MGTIKIKQIMFGSPNRTENIGDGLLAFAGDSSSDAQAVRAKFIDNPPYLSTKYSSVVFRRLFKENLYSIVHVQGSAVVNKGMGRQYPYRAAYEILANDTQGIDKHLHATLLESVPRIREYEVGRNKLLEDCGLKLVGKARNDSASLNLSRHILKAFLQKKRLYVSLPISKDYSFNGSIDSDEIKILTDAVDILPLKLNQVCSWAFCVDENYTSEKRNDILDDVLVVVYAEGSEMKIPNDVLHEKWSEATSRGCELSDNDEKILKLALDRNDVIFSSSMNVLETIGGMTEKIKAIGKKSKKEFDQSDWDLYIKLNEVPKLLPDFGVTNWSDAAYVYARLPEGLRKTLRGLLKQNDSTFGVNTLNKEVYGVLNLKVLGLRPDLQKIVLKDWIKGNDKGRRYEFLFLESSSSDGEKQYSIEPSLGKDVQSIVGDLCGEVTSCSEIIKLCDDLSRKGITSPASLCKARFDELVELNHKTKSCPKFIDIINYCYPTFSHNWYKKIEVDVDIDLDFNDIKKEYGKQLTIEDSDAKDAVLCHLKTCLRKKIEREYSRSIVNIDDLMDVLKRGRVEEVSGRIGCTKSSDIAKLLESDKENCWDNLDSILRYLVKHEVRGEQVYRNLWRGIYMFLDRRMSKHAKLAQKREDLNWQWKNFLDYARKNGRKRKLLYSFIEINLDRWGIKVDINRKLHDKPNGFFAKVLRWYQDRKQRAATQAIANFEKEDFGGDCEARVKEDVELMKKV